eukprot:scaffold81600_cov15-Tisochrysis_lutea.AAC.1
MAAQKKRQEEQEEKDRLQKRQAEAQQKEAAGPAGSTDGVTAKSNGASPVGSGSVIDSIAASAKAREARDKEAEEKANESRTKDGGNWLKSLGGGLQGWRWVGGKGGSK